MSCFSVNVCNKTVTKRNEFWLQIIVIKSFSCCQHGNKKLYATQAAGQNGNGMSKTVVCSSWKQYTIEGFCTKWGIHDKIKHKFHNSVKQFHYLYFRADDIRDNNLRNVVVWGSCVVLGIEEIDIQVCTL